MHSNMNRLLKYRIIISLTLVISLMCPVFAYAVDEDLGLIPEDGYLDEFIESDNQESSEPVTEPSDDEEVTQDIETIEPELIDNEVIEDNEEPKLKTFSSRAKEEDLIDIEVKASGEDGTITAFWKKVDEADYYLATVSDEDTGEVVKPENNETECKTEFSGLNLGENYTITIKAYKKEDAEEDALIGEGSLHGVKSSGRKRISISSTNPINLGINLRTLIGEDSAGYSVVQGGCVDEKGIYAYYLMVSPYNQNGRILKLRCSDNAVVASSGVINIEHGNGMAIDTTRNRLVIVGREGWRNKLTLVDASSLNLIGYVDVDYSYPIKYKYPTTDPDRGLSAISYIRKYDCYLALQRGTHDLLVLDPNFKVIGLIYTKITADYPGLYQAMDADDRYAYLLLSPYESQNNNIILVLDWNSENLLKIDNAVGPKYIEKAWYCNNDKDANGKRGRPDTVIKTGTPYESQNIYHIEQGDGTSRFYLSTYYNNPQTKYVTKNKKVKVKWKKVKKKVKVKWKKVKKKVKVKWKKVNGKWKYKTKYKKVWKYKKKYKKVWKYKTKYKKVKVKAGTYLSRENYVYDLGVF